MALVVEDGTGKSTAEAYDSTANAALYLLEVGSTVFDALAAGPQEEAARRATRYMEREWRTEWKGNKTLETQALAWPRYNVVDEDGFVVDSDSVPLAVREAFAEACEMAAVSGADLEPDVAPPLQSVKIDVLEVEWFQGSQTETMRAKVLGKIRFLLDQSNTLARSA